MLKSHEAQIAQLPDRRTAPNAQIMPQDLWLRPYIDLTWKLDAPDAWNAFGVRAALCSIFKKKLFVHGVPYGVENADWKNNFASG